MDNEVAHHGVIDGALGRTFPGRKGCLIIRKNSYDVEAGDITEIMTIERCQFAAKDKVQERSIRVGI